MKTAVLTKKNTVTKNNVPTPRNGTGKPTTLKVSAKPKAQEVGSEEEDELETDTQKDMAVKRGRGRPAKLDTPLIAGTRTASTAENKAIANKTKPTAVASPSQATGKATIMTTNKVATPKSAVASTNGKSAPAVVFGGRGRPASLSSYTKGQNVHVLLPNGKTAKGTFKQVSKKGLDAQGNPTQALVIVGDETYTLPSKHIKAA